MSLINKFSLVTEGKYVEDGPFGYRIDRIVYSPAEQELAVAIVRINIATAAQTRIVETVSFKKATPAKIAAVKETLGDVADRVDHIQAPDTEADEPKVTTKPVRAKRGSRTAS